MSKANVHLEIIYKNTFHSFPYQKMHINFDGPHAEDCEGCIIEAEATKLVQELESLSHVEELKADLQRERELRQVLSDERHEALKAAGVNDHGQSVAEVVGYIVREQDRLERLLRYVEEDVNDLVQKMKER